MLLDWFVREGGFFVSWWLLATLAGLVAFPLCYRMLGGLPDRGYTLARSIGILLVAFVFWFGASLGIFTNSTGNMVLAALIVGAIGVLAYSTMPERLSLREYWRENKPVIIASEVLFAVLLLGFMVVRALYPDTWTTEKPMDLMFISSIMRSPTFPPLDGWMAGYGISYYHFGYVMAAMLSKLSNVSSTIGFSMTLSLWFAMTGVNAFGVVYNLIRSRSQNAEHPEHVLQNRRAPIAFALLGTVFVIFLSNFQFPLVEVPWQAGAGNADYYNYWAAQERLDDSPKLDATSVISDPNTWDYWWFFRASRVLQDFPLSGQELPSWYAQPIDEFPAFSFLLGDSHPHVLALPFGIMALGLALNVLLARRNPSLYDLLFYGITIGAFVFLNTWDILAYFGAFLGADTLRRLFKNENGRLSWEDIIGLIGDVVVFLAITAVSYGLFLYSFRSQAGGITYNLMFPTYFPQFFLMFGPFLLILSGFLAVMSWRGRLRMNWRWGFGAVGISVAIIAVVTLGFLLVLALVPNVQSLSLQFINETGGMEANLSALLLRRLTYLPVTLLGLLAIFVVVSRLFPRAPRFPDGQPTITLTKSSAFVLLLVAIGAVLVIAPEFVHLVDVFSSRINTIFKFYYQVWALWAIASAYAVYSVLGENREQRPTPTLRYLFGGMVVLIVMSGSLYFFFGVYARTFNEPFQSGFGAKSYFIGDSRLVVADGQDVNAGQVLLESAIVGGQTVVAPYNGQVQLRERTLWVRANYSIDGGPLMIDRDDYTAIQCLAKIAVDGEIAIEAELHAYNAAYGRVASLTGIPILLGWEGHERQWRGNTIGEILGSRPSDIDRFYRDLRWEVALEVIQRYGINYVMFGATEIQQYTVTGEQKFVENLIPVCQSGATTIYKVPNTLLIQK